MHRMRLLRSVAPLCALAACGSLPTNQDPVVPSKDFTIQAGKPIASQPNEPHLRNIRQLTFDGENAEAYWSNDGTKLVFQRKAAGMAADQIYVFDLATGKTELISSGTGRTTCSYFTQGDKRIVYASTHHQGDAPPVVKMTGRGYQWAVHQEYDIFDVDPKGGDMRQLTKTEGYDAEATVCPVTGDIVFTSVRDGDLELYTMNADGGNVKRITNRPGYDGGAFFSHDGSKFVLRSAFPKNEEEAKANADLLGQQIVKPSHMEITVCDRDGSNFRQVTNNGAANFGPFWLPDDEHIIFSSNMIGVENFAKTGDHTGMREFEIFTIKADGTDLERITNSPEFDGFPMFSPCGRYLVFASNRNNQTKGDTNLFVAEWVK
jgi:TolB protein